MENPYSSEYFFTYSSKLSFGQHDVLRVTYISMKLIHLLISLLGICFTWNICATDAPAKPNILIILADDLGWSDLGCYGGEIRTPNLDKLASNGLRFTQFYNSTRCCPSRASLLTGLYPHQAGVGEMTNDRNLPGYRGSLQPNCVTIAQVLKPVGYHTGAFGKWHVGDHTLPNDRGFDDFYGFVRGYAVDSWEPRMMIQLPERKPARTYKPGEYFATDAITDHALDFLTDARKDKQPWLMYLAYQAPHFPLHSKTEDMEGYDDVYAKGWDKIREQRLERQIKLGLVSADTRLTARSKIPLQAVATRYGSITDDGNNPPWESLPAERRADLARRMAVYAGMVSGMDRNIGRVIADLKEKGDLDNTLIFFMSDNGACAEWEPFGFDLKSTPNPQPGTGVNGGTPSAPNILHKGDELKNVGGPGSMIGYGSAWANTCNTPWRLYKHYAHEGGISTPLIVHWPAGIKSTGQLRGQVGHLIDIMATCIDVSGAKYPSEIASIKITPAQGVSLLPAFMDRPLQREFVAFEHEGNRALRSGDWKITCQAGQPWELYDIAKDRTELTNLAAEQPQRVKQLADQWEKWANQVQVLPNGNKKKNAAAE